jgi:hypothetical protein
VLFNSGLLVSARGAHTSKMAIFSSAEPSLAKRLRNSGSNRMSMRAGMLTTRLLRMDLTKVC